MPHSRRSNKITRTTIGELAAAYYDSALSELKDAAQAARLTQLMLAKAVARARALR